MEVKQPLEGYVRCDTLMPILASQVVPIPGQPTRRVLGLMTEDGALSLGVTAESAQDISDQLAEAAMEMRKLG